MTTMMKKFLFGLLLILVSIQFIRPTKNSGPAPSPNDIQLRLLPSQQIRGLLENACYDCHSNHTTYPWYAQVQPFGWWLANHINEGKRHLNFSDFSKLAPKRAVRKLQQAADELNEEEMPLTSYKLTHPAARLTDAERKTLADWFIAVRSTYPAEELK